METSAFNAEAPTEPAGETVGCRRQLGGIVRLILCDFVKSLSHFFVSKKRQLPLQGSLYGQPQGLSLRSHIKFNLIATVSCYISANLIFHSRAVACCRRWITTNQWLQQLYFILYRRGELCSPILIRCELAGDRRSPLRFNVFFNLTTPDHHHISDNSLGRSKPLPYIVGY